MQQFRITYLRNSYMEVEVAAVDSHDAEAQFEILAATEPFACEHGNMLAIPRYHIVDVTAVRSCASERRSAKPQHEVPARADPTMIERTPLRQMMVLHGMDLTGGWSRGLEEIIPRALQTCAHCRDKALCESWLERTAPHGYPSFCPNTRIIEVCRILDPAAPPLATRGGGMAQREPPMA